MLSIRLVGFFLLLSAIIIGIVGFLNQHSGLDFGDTANSILREFYANVSTELGSIAITILVVDRIVQKSQMQREKSQLIREMGSTDNSVALRAVKELHANGWLEDGSLCGADLSEANLQNAKLYRADLRAVLVHANLAGADLTGSNLCGADLRGAKLQKANLSFANLTDARLRGADLEEANLDRANLHNANLAGGFHPLQPWEGANLKNARIQLANLDGARLAYTNLQGVRFSGLGQPAKAWSMVGAIWNDGVRYDGRFNLKGDIDEPQMNPSGPFVPNKNNPKAMAKFYGVSLKEYVSGQEWATNFLADAIAQQEDNITAIPKKESKTILTTVLSFVKRIIKQ